MEADLMKRPYRLGTQGYLTEVAINKATRCYVKMQEGLAYKRLSDYIRDVIRNKDLKPTGGKLRNYHYLCRPIKLKSSL